MAERRSGRAGAILATAAAMLALDLTWIGLAARGIYSAALGPLLRPEAFWPAAALFYLFYVAVTVSWAVLPAEGPLPAARRGAALGLVAYATYELTNWAVLKDWPAWIVPIDVAWGVFLTAASALAGKLVELRARRPGDGTESPPGRPATSGEAGPPRAS